MTDDTLREECEDLALKIIAEITVHPTGHFDRDANEWDAKALTVADFSAVIQKHLLAFARAQQAKGLREAVAIGRATISALYQASPSHARGIEVVNALVDAQATARESDATKKGSSPS